MIDLTEAEIERYWSYVNRSDGCWLWTGELNNKGYGRFAIYRKGQRTRLLAHRVAYRLIKGVDLGTQLARHRCDTPPCCNPEDLLAGTQLENIHDALNRGRFDKRGLDIGRAQNRARALAIITAGEKYCGRCDQVKPLDQFYRHRRQLIGVQSECKECQRGRH